jgi:endoglucanase
MLSHRARCTSCLALLFAFACHRPSEPARFPEPAATGAPLHVAAASAPEKPGPWDAPYPERFDAGLIHKPLGLIRVDGNRFIDASGAPVVFQGVNISDPDKLEQNGHWNRHHFEVIREWGANVVRIPVHPAAWRARGKQSYLSLLDQAVVWATELDLYLIIDWHSIGNLVTGLFQHPMYDTTQQETLEFWRSIAFRYKGVPTLAFYELFNEPTLQNGRLGMASWDQWKALNEEMISIIYAHEKQAIPLVAGFDWAYDLGPIAAQPVAREGIAYVSHPYPQKTHAPFEQNWDKSFGFAKQKYPLFITEIGYMRADTPGAHEPVKDDGTYGQRMTDYLAAKGASWTAWCFDPDWPPQLISDWNYTPTEAGAHFRDVMLARSKRK